MYIDNSLLLCILGSIILLTPALRILVNYFFQKKDAYFKDNDMNFIIAGGLIFTYGLILLLFN